MLMYVISVISELFMENDIISLTEVSCKCIYKGYLFMYICI